MVSEVGSSSTIWPQSVSSQSYFRSGNVSQNWKDFQEQLSWVLAVTDSSDESDMVKTDESDMVKINNVVTRQKRGKREVHKTLQWNEEGDNQKFNKVIEAFRWYYSPRKHILYERYTFWILQQEKEESVDAYLTQIKLKPDMFEYAAEVCQELTRDKFVIGLIDDCLRKDFSTKKT